MTTTPVLAAVLTAAAEEESGWAAAYPVIPHPGELIAGTICFAILLFVAYRFAVPRLETMLAQRQAAIEGGMEKAEKAQAEAQAALEEYRAQLADARAEAARIREEARSEGAKILVEMRERAAAEAERITESAGRQVEAERMAAVTSLRTELGGLATQLAGRIVGEALTDSARQSRIVERFLTELEQSSPDDVRASADRVGGAHAAGSSEEPAAPTGSAGPAAPSGSKGGSTAVPKLRKGR